MKKFIFYLSFFLSLTIVHGQDDKEKELPILKSALNGFSFRSIGPAFMSGRIADIAIDANNTNIWYVAVGSGGVWKTTNAGTTWKPLTDAQKFYSTGSITIDPNNSSTIWLGTGENVGGRHVGIGHGVYVSHDAGSSWSLSGLESSEHISKIIVHPTNSNIVWVASQGPLWSNGGERGLYKTTDGGKTWVNCLKIDDWTGVTDLVIDSRNPDVLYAASWQRHRNVAAYMGGGPGTGLYKSTDGGNTWRKINKGLPVGSMGKIGLAISPIQPDVLYAAIELDRRKGGVYRSDNGGASWKKMSDTVSGGTGPHYYQELIASPHVFDKIYLMNVRTLVSENGGKTFYTMKESNKHSDNHSLTFTDDPNYLLIGTDGGIYESFDDTQSWRFVSNLPLTQFYKLAVDDAKPFYNIFGGTQDNNTQGGPSRTFRSNGIVNSDWFVLLGGDGHQPATEPGNPNIVYAQWQQGNLNRIDRTTGEAVYIKPQSGLGEDYERFNWDAPILVSHHDPKRLYFGSQRVWKSENRGDSWIPISKDLTKNEERLSLPIMGRQQSWDAAWDVYAMSTYNTLTSLAESPLNPDVLYAGSDDGIIQYTKDGGSSWTKMTVDKLPDTPTTAFVNDIKADLHDENTAYVALDNHKFGDYKPYLFKTTDGGKKWKSITEGLPDHTLVWRLVQDHVNKDLLFLATEYGVYVSLNQGGEWHKFSNGLPTISVRDLVIQKRENDLVLATFGRGFYVLDDYSALRELTDQTKLSSAQLFTPRKALQYNPINGGTSSQGASYFTAKNPKYGATISYYIPDVPSRLKSKRKKAEKELKDEDIPFPGWDALDAEENEGKNEALIVISDANGNVVDQIKAPLGKGLKQMQWDLKTTLPTVMRNKSSNTGLRIHVDPGTYTAQLHQRIGGQLTSLSTPVSFEVEQIRKNVLNNPLEDQMDDYLDNVIEMFTTLNLAENKFEKSSTKLNTIMKSLGYVKSNQVELTQEAYDLRDEMNRLKIMIEGSPARAEIGEKDQPTITDRLYFSISGISRNSYGPTALHMESFKMTQQLWKAYQPQMTSFSAKVEDLARRLEEVGGPKIMD